MEGDGQLADPYHDCVSADVNVYPTHFETYHRSMAFLLPSFTLALPMLLTFACLLALLSPGGVGGLMCGRSASDLTCVGVTGGAPGPDPLPPPPPLLVFGWEVPDHGT